MPWITLPEACAALGCSDRTLSRRIGSGTYESKYEGGRKMVYLPLDQAHKPLGQMAEAGRQMAEVASASAVQRQADQQTLSRQVDMAERHTKSAWKVAYCGLAVSSILVVGFAGYVAWSLVKLDSERSAKSAMSDKVAEHKTRSEIVSGLLTDERERADSLTGQVITLTSEKAATEAREAMLRDNLDRIDGERIEAVKTAQNAKNENVRLQHKFLREMAALEARLDIATKRLGWLGVDLLGDPDQVADSGG